MTYRERLSAPLSYWFIAYAFGITFVIAIGFYLGPWAAVASGVVTAVGITIALLLIGRPVVAVGADGVRVGDSLLEWPYVGPTTVHDREGTRRRLGPDALASAWVVQRPYVPASVEVTVADAADPHPYWLVSSRNPGQLAAAIEQARCDAAAGGRP